MRLANLQCEYLTNPLGIDVSAPRLSWQMDDETQGALQSSYQLIIGTDSAAVSHNTGNAWQTLKIKSDEQRTTYHGKKLLPFTRYYWKVNEWDKNNRLITSKISFFETGMIDQRNWRGAWIRDIRDIDLKPAARFRKTFSLNKKILRARAYIAAAGLYELFINGQRIGDHRLDPMYTRFDRRTLYVTYDVTSQLQQGNNAIGVSLGNGWYNHQSTAVWYFDKAPWRARPAFCLDLQITYSDQSVETISTDRNWKTTLGPTDFNSIYTGEHYDARKEMPDWNRPSFVDSAWSDAIYAPAPSSHIVAQNIRPIRFCEEIPAMNMRKISDTVYVFDLGRNIAGLSQVRLKGEEGTVVRVRHGERLYPNGRVDLSNIDVHYRPTDNTDPFQTDIYILKGGDTAEGFMPHFNYKGFQYVEITSDKPINLSEEAVTGYFMHSDVPPIGKINSSNEIINKIWTAANNSYLSNLYGYPTDCPQREKNGWTGDAQIASETGLYNFDAITVYEKWMADHRDEQQPNGVLPSIVPTGGWGYEWGNGPDWTSTIAIIPWNLYLFYGDDKTLFDCYDNIKRYVDHINELYPSGLCSWGLGDWVPVKSKADVQLTSTCYYYADVAILVKAAKLLHKNDDYTAYSSLAEKIKLAFNKKYFNAEKNIYASGIQTELAVPLFWGLVPENLKTKVAESLAKKVLSDSTKLDVGLLGTKAILNSLSENGYADLAYQLASKESYPSWGWWIVHGATTLHENWPLDAGSDISLNHIMFGEISAWFYKALGGIKPDPVHPGFKNVLIEPHFVQRLDHFYCEHDGPYGKIISSWKRNNGAIEYTVVIPANSSASVTLPGKTMQLFSGKYVFTIKE